MAFRNSRNLQLVRFLSLDEGVNTFSSKTAAPEKTLRAATNIIVNADGLLKRKPGFVNLSANALTSYNSLAFVKTNGYRALLLNSGTDIYKLATLTGTITSIQSGVTSGRKYTYALSSNRRVYMGNGVQADAYQLSSSGGTVTLWGLAAPTVAPTFSTADAGSLTFVNGGRRGAYSWKNSVTGHISNAKVSATATGNITGKEIDYTVSTTGAPAGTDQVVIYETTDGTNSFWFSGTVSYGTATYTSNVLDSTLTASGHRAPFFDNHRPPPGKLVVRYKGRIFVSGIDDEPSFVYFSDDPFSKVNGVSEESFTEYQGATSSRRFSVPAQGETITALATHADRLWIFTEDRYYWFYGDDEFTFAQPREAAGEKGTKSHYSVVKTPYGLFWFSSDKKVLLATGNEREPEEVSLPIRDRLVTVDAATVSGAYYSYGANEWVIFTGQRKDGSFFSCLYDISTENGSWSFFDDSDDLFYTVWEESNGDKVLISATDDTVGTGKIVKVIPIEDETPTGIHPEAEFRTKFLTPQSLGVDGLFSYVRFLTDNEDLEIEVFADYDFQNDVNGGDAMEVERLSRFEYQAWVKPGKEYSCSIQFRFKFPRQSEVGGVYALIVGFKQQNIS